MNTLASCVTDVSTEQTDFFFKNKKFEKIIFKFFSIFFRKLTEFQLTFFSNIKKLTTKILEFLNFQIFFQIFCSKNFFYENFFLQIFL